MPRDASDAKIRLGRRSDHFGASWQINPQLLIDLITGPATTAKAQAMMEMGKSKVGS